MPMSLVISRQGLRYCAERRGSRVLPYAIRVAHGNVARGSALVDDRKPVLPQFLARLHVMAGIGRRGTAGALDIAGIVADPAQRQRPAPRRGQIAARAMRGAEVEQDG